MSCVPCAMVLGLPFVSVNVIVRFACRYRAPERSVHHASYPARSRSAFAALVSNVRFAPGSEEHTYELHSRSHLVSRLLLEPKASDIVVRRKILVVVTDIAQPYVFTYQATFSDSVA